MSGHQRIEGHPGFYERGDKVVFRVRDRRGDLRWHSAANLEQAVRARILQKDAVARGEDRAASRERFADYARSWIETYAGRTARGLQEETRDEYRSRLERDAIPHFGQMRLSAIDQRDMKEYVRALAARTTEAGEPVSADTVRLGVAPVRALLATACEEGLIRSNPAAGLRLTVVRERRLDDEDEDEQVKAMSEPELARLLAALPAEWRLFHRFLAQTGLRIGEAIELRWRDVDLDARTVRVRRRFRKGRVGPLKSRFGRRRLRLTPELARELRRTRAAAADGELVFTTSGGARIDPSNLMSRVLKPAAVRAGLGVWKLERGRRRAESWVGFHSFRHTCATLLFARGWNAKQVQRWLGHHKASFTLDTYVHLLPDDLPEPVAFGDPAGEKTLGDTLATPNRPKEAEPAAAVEAAKPLTSSASAS